MKKLLTYSILSVMMFLYGFTSLGGAVVSAWNADDPFVLVPEAESDWWVEDVKKLQKIEKDKDFRTDYNTAWDEFAGDDDVGSQMASWIVTRDTILLLVVRIVKFVSNAALVVGSLMVIYAWYLYVMSAIAWDQTSQANEAIKDAIIGIVVVIFSYAIQKFVIEAFLA
jgi:hypothetical protein